MVYDMGLNNESKAEDKLKLRGAELMFYAPVDHLFEGKLSAAAHDENGETVFELHELVLSSNKIIPGVRAKVGQFFLGVGKLNPAHQHDWAFTLSPMFQRSFFDDEGVFDSGLEVAGLLPLPFYADLTVGLTSGHRYGHSHTAGSKPDAPTHYARLSFFTEFGAASGFEYALNYLGRTDAAGTALKLAGLDLTYKVRRAKMLSYLLQSEIWYKDEKSDDQITRNELLGGYLYQQVGLNPIWSIGLQTGLLKNLNQKNALTNKKINHIQYEVGPNLTYKASEFSTIRLSFNHEFKREEGATLSKDTEALLQFVFILGSHPAHTF